MNESDARAVNKPRFFESACDPSVDRRRPAWKGREPSTLSQERVDDAVDRTSLRGTVERPGRERIPDEVIDQLLAGASASRSPAT
jgi:hypothetical protein